MLTISYSRYGTAGELRLEEVAEPTPGPGEVRVRVRAVSLNGSDAEFLSGRPLYARLNGIFRPRVRVLGSDVAGVVDAVGPGVTAHAPGDAVFGDLFELFGCLAEAVCAPAERFLPLPEGVTFEQAAALPQAGVIALQAMRDVRCVQPTERVAILGAGGGLGTFAVQIAKHLGAEVTAVDHGSKGVLLESLGADHVVDYTTEDFVDIGLDTGPGYDLILDVPGRRSVRECVRALAPGGVYSIVGGHIRHLLSAFLLGRWAALTRQDRKVGLLMWDMNIEDLAAVAELVRDGHVTPVIDRSVPLERAPEAFALLAEGRVNGKIVITSEA